MEADEVKALAKRLADLAMQEGAQAVIVTIMGPGKVAFGPGETVVHDSELANYGFWKVGKVAPEVFRFMLHKIEEFLGFSPILYQAVFGGRAPPTVVGGAGGSLGGGGGGSNGPPPPPLGYDADGKPIHGVACGGVAGIGGNGSNTRLTVDDQGNPVIIGGGGASSQ